MDAGVWRLVSWVGKGHANPSSSTEIVQMENKENILGKGVSHAGKLNK